MTEQRQKLLDRFDKWLDSKPRKQIISAQCANIAEEYAEEQLRLHVVSQQRELLIDFCTKLELKAKQYSYLIPDEDFIDEYLEAINYTHCCEEFADGKCRPMVNADWTYLRCECGKRNK